MSGKYRITALGAQGSESGGKGGEVVGEINLNTGEILTIDVGGTNGYNGGGAYNNIEYIQGGGATTVKYNGVTVITAAGGGGGATGTAGGSGNGAGGDSVGSGTGIAGTNGGGGSKSPNHSAQVNCVETGGECTKSTKVRVCKSVCTGSGSCCTTQTRCESRAPIRVTCDTQVTSGKGGNGGTNANTSNITNVIKSDDINIGDGKLIIQYID